MKKIFFYILTGLIPSVLFAQMGKPYEMNVNGVKVIVQPSGNEIVEILTIIKGGVQNYSFDKQGIESLAMNGLTECGTKNDDKNSFKDKLDKLSAQVYASAARDFSTNSAPSTDLRIPRPLLNRSSFITFSWKLKTIIQTQRRAPRSQKVRSNPR